MVIVILIFKFLKALLKKKEGPVIQPKPLNGKVITLNYLSQNIILCKIV